MLGVDGQSARIAAVEAPSTGLDNATTQGKIDWLTKCMYYWMIDCLWNLMIEWWFRRLLIDKSLLLGRWLIGSFTGTFS